MNRPAYLRIAEELRARIFDGTYPPGTKLPTAAELSRRYRVSDIVARMAMAVLRNQGLVTTRTRAGTVVRHRPPIRRIAGERYRIVSGAPAESPETSFTRDYGIRWEQYQLDKHFQVETASPELASIFEVEPGTRVLARRFTFYAGPEPEQMSVSYLLLDDVDGTPVADPANEPWPGGTPAELASLGIVVTRIEESVRARMPTPEELERLAIGAGVPVFAITRRMIAKDRVVEVAADIVIPADRTVLDYVIDMDT